MRHIIGGQIGYDNNLIKQSNFLKKKKILSNGRSALYVILKEIKKKIKLVYLPSYLCESILQPIKELNLDYKFYKVDKNFNFKLPNKKNSVVIFLNYFGKENQNLKKIKNNTKDNIFYIKDCTHDIFNKKHDFKDFNKNNIYRFASIKKYVPFPVGAITNRDNLKLGKENKKDNLIFKNFFKVLKERNKYFSFPKKKIDLKLEYKLLNKQSGFKNFENSKILKNKFPLFIKNKILKYDLESILKKRDKNFVYFKKKINKKIKIISKNYSYPLNFTILLTRNKKKEILKLLKKNRIFPSTLWPIPKQVDVKKFKYSHELSNSLLSLPIDHRYKKKDIEFMISIIHKALKL